MEFKDYYKILGLARDATQDEIKRAYRKLARKFHPDVSKAPDAEARMKEVNEAYEVLQDPEKRSAYDRLGNHWQAGQEFRPPPDWDTGFSFRDQDFAPSGVGGFSDFFESLFGGLGGWREVRSSGFSRRGDDRRAKVTIGLEDAFHGTTRMITLHEPVLDASGRARTKSRTLNVHVPKGISEGRQIRLAGQGSPGSGGGPNGDLYLEVTFDAHPYFRAVGKDIYFELPITPWEAALGAHVAVMTLGGKVALTIPSNSQSGRKLRLRGRGLPGHPPGDQYVVINIVVPPADTQAARDFYRRMAQEMSFNPRRDWD